MQYDKTDKGREAVAAGPAAGLGLQDRRILILVDGKRSMQQLVAMLGNDIVPRVERLLRDGYIAPDAATVPARALAPAQTPATGTRRSLAASKMYMLDMLQLQRTPEAAELRASIQCASAPDALVDALIAAMQSIVSVSTPSYGERVARRLAETLPLEAVPRLEARAAGRNGAHPALSIVA
ncbi:MAG: hypothetical protein M3Y70_10910 [Pseudomonadota bacterium]|nr:hypothetical protein [Pseudomonadota bacterium]